jgi:transcriptional regulator with XRE-family HTH domain
VPRLTQRDLLFVAQVRADLASGRAREARRAAGVTLAEMAAALTAQGKRISPQALSQWERRKPDGTPVRRPDTEHALEYGRLLEKLTAKTAPAAA